MAETMVITMNYSNDSLSPDFGPNNYNRTIELTGYLLACE